MHPGEYLLDESAGEIIANAGRVVARVIVRNRGDRPIQVGSHFHFFEVNGQLEFERTAAYGMRLNVPAGTAVRFEPGDEKEIELVAFAGERIVLGHRGLVNGSL
jgi:urease beta subunit